MRTRDTLLPLLFLLAGCAGDPPAPTSPADPQATGDALERYRQLTGAWIDSTTSNEYTCYEQWTAAGDSALIGYGYVMAKGDTVFIEDLRIHEQGGKVVYSARIDTQNNGEWVPFTALASGTDSLVFENPGHDFPQCIVYVKDSSGTWEVAVTGNESGEDRTEHFRFVRN